MEAAYGFFARRKPTGLNPPPQDFGLAEYVNISPIIGILVSTRLATLHELSTVYGLEDAYLLLEIHSVDSHNQRVINERNKT